MRFLRFFCALVGSFLAVHWFGVCFGFDSPSSPIGMGSNPLLGIDIEFCVAQIGSDKAYKLCGLFVVVYWLIWLRLGLCLVFLFLKVLFVSLFIFLFIIFVHFGGTMEGME